MPRIRMFAGPNGSGKTTVKNSLLKSASWFGIYINPDDLEKQVRDDGVLSLVPFALSMSTEEVRHFFTTSTLLAKQNLAEAANSIDCRNDEIDFRKLEFNSYYASVLADLLRRGALHAKRSFTFETVMSARDKVELLAESQAMGFRTYLYYIATEDPAINIRRVKQRVADGGHDVPEEKIVSRYARSLALLPQAIRFANRAYLFDTSEEQAWFFAEVTDGISIELKSEEIPNWFQATWEELSPE